MDRWLWRWLGLAVVLASIAVIVYVPDPTAQEPSLLSNQQLLDRLGSSRQVVREAAANELLTRAKSVIPTLTTEVVRSDEARRDALMWILQELFLSSDPIVCEAAESAIEELSRNPDEAVSKSADAILEANANLRHARALSHLIPLGAHVRDLELAAELRENPKSHVDETPLFLQARILLFDHRWLGGDDGLKYVARIYPFDALALHLTDDAPISDEGLRQLRTHRARISVRHEHESCLGVLVDERRQSNAEGVYFSQVVANSPAAYAGLRRGDLLISFNGRTVRTFAELQEHAASCHPGDRITLRFLRHGVVYRAKLPLGSDFSTGICRCETAEVDASR